MTVPAYTRDVLTFPLRSDALPMLAIGTVISFVMNFTAFAGFLGTLASLIWFGFLCATFFSLILSSTNEHAGGPEFADAGNIVDDVIGPMVRVVLVALVSMAPLIAYLLTAEAPDENGLTTKALTVLAAVYFPMAILAVAVLNNIFAANPVLVLLSIFRTFPYYVLCVALIVAVYFFGLWLAAAFSTKSGSLGQPTRSLACSP